MRKTMPILILITILSASKCQAGIQQNSQAQEPRHGVSQADRDQQALMFDSSNPEHLKLIGLNYLNIVLERGNAGSLDEADSYGWLYPSIPTFGYLLSKNGWGQRVNASAPFIGTAYNRPPSDDTFDGLIDSYIPRYRFDLVAIQHKIFGLDFKRVKLPDKNLMRHLEDIALSAPNLTILNELYGVINPSRDLEVELIPYSIPISDSVNNYNLLQAPLVAAVNIFNEKMEFAKKFVSAAFVKGYGSREGIQEAARIKGFGYIQTGVSRDENGISLEGVIVVYRLSQEIARSVFAW